MRICLFGQGPLCEAVEAALRAQGHQLIGPYASPQPTEVLKSAQASVGLSCGYRHKLKAEEWGCFPDGILNLHTSYLPWNRGAHPNVWPILDGSPAGVTLHRVDEGWDTGPILWQARCPVEPFDTAKTLYDKLLAQATVAVVVAMQAFGGAWPQGTPQDPTAGSFHRKAELAGLADVMDEYGAKSVVDHLRAASFPGYGLRYRQDGKLLEATISIKAVGDADTR